MSIFNLLEKFFSTDVVEKPLDFQIDAKSSTEEPPSNTKPPQPNSFKKSNYQREFKKPFNKSEDSFPKKDPSISTCYVLDVIDGDTFVAMHNSEKKKFRLSEIDSPELAHDQQDAQPFSEEAKTFLLQTIKQKVLYITLKGEDKYGRLIIDAFLDKERTKNINDLMLAKGLAVSKRYTNSEGELTQNSEDFHADQAIENVAKTQENGVWSHKP